MGMRSTWSGEICGRSREICGRSRGRRTSWRPRLEPAELAWHAQGSCSQSRTGAPTCRPAWRCSRPACRRLERRAAAGASSSPGPAAGRAAAAPAPSPSASRPRLLARGSRGLSCGCAGVAGGGLSRADARRAGVERLVGHGDGAERGGQRNDAAAHGDYGGAVEHRHLEQHGVQALLSTPLTKNTNHGEGAAQAEARLCTSLPRSRPVDSVCHGLDVERMCPTSV